MFVSTPDDPVAEIRRLTGELAGERLAGQPGAVLSQRVVDLAGALERLEAELVRTVGQWDAVGAWAEEGAASAASWLATRTRTPRVDAARMVRSARLVRRHHRTGDALALGTISCAQSEILATVARGRSACYSDAEEILLNAAEALPVDDFAIAARRWRSVVDDQLEVTDPGGEVRDELFLSATLAGRVDVAGALSADAGATLIEALDALVGPDPVDGPIAPRSLPERRAEALVQLAARSLGGEAGSGRPRVAASLVMDVGSLVGAPRDLAAVRLDLERVGPIGAETARRLCCDASVARVVMAGPSEVLDLGRSTRLVTPALRRALVLRDRGCGFPGCDRPPEWCDAHHVVPWSAGGETNLQNLVLLCRRHHVCCHEGKWRLARGPDGALTATLPASRARPELVLAA
jgi:hypothetical protein